MKKWEKTSWRDRGCILETWSKIEIESLLECQSNTSTISPGSQLGMADNGFGGPCAGYILATGIADAATNFVDVHSLKEWGVATFSTSFSLWLQFPHCLAFGFVSSPAFLIVCPQVHGSPCNFSFLLPCRGIHLAVLILLLLCDPVLLYCNKYLGKKRKKREKKTKRKNPTFLWLFNN